MSLYSDGFLGILICVIVYLIIKLEFGFFYLTIDKEFVKKDFWEQLCRKVNIDPIKEDHFTVKCRKGYVTTKFGWDEPEC